MNKQEMDKLRSSVLYQDEILEVIYTGDAINFPKNTPIVAHSNSAMRSGLPYPEPKWIACDYYVIDSDYDKFYIARERYGELAKDFKWVRKE